MSARISSSDGAPRSQVIDRATTERRLDVKSAPWYGNNPPEPPGGDEFAPRPVAESAVSLGGQDPSEEIGPLDDAGSPPPLVSTSSASVD